MILTLINWIILYLIAGFVFLCAVVRTHKEYNPNDSLDPGPAAVIFLWPIFLLMYFMAELEHEIEVEAANEMVAEIRKMFTDEEVEQIKLDLENEEVEDFQVEVPDDDLDRN